ncbi:DUF4199 domain-containing protein [Flavisolibacter ginsenosidimutans]|uniref:DUF4199 domain-containing protein n=1 Tax=Flavisolibacter ginsenosidimutans TaxID=661481 RepID=A0A5B8UEW7_9BACT|nr:DUF4199 domain-containing protein [Flavisolibacter ginsenosidimutans]QEC54846.1 DUF4199 domain-containing protein [Flavisolibacter ginsenosidimutans]
MEEKKPLSHIVAGLLISVAVILFSTVMTVAGGANAGPNGGWISYLIIIFGIVFFVQRYGKTIDYRATFGDYFSYGFKASMIVVLMFVVFLTVLSFVMPEIKQKVLEATRLELEKQRNVTDRDIDSVMQMTNKYFWVVMIGTSVFFFCLIGAVGSLIGAAVTKKLPKNPFESTSL